MAEGHSPNYPGAIDAVEGYHHPRPVVQLSQKLAERIKEAGITWRDSNNDPVDPGSSTTQMTSEREIGSLDELVETVYDISTTLADKKEAIDSVRAAIRSAYPLQGGS